MSGTNEADAPGRAGSGHLTDVAIAKLQVTFTCLCLRC